MKELIFLLFGGVGGFLIHSITMKVSFKQRLIDQKVKVYDALIAHWVKMRNFIYTHHTGVPNPELPYEVIREFDQMYGLSQTFIGEAILVCEDSQLAEDVNQLNEDFYRKEWHLLSLEQANEEMENLKLRAIGIISRMREDIKASTRFERKDFSHIFSGLFGKSLNT